MQRFERANGALPPAWIADSDGRPLHSWRVLLLPYLEEEKLYREFRLDEPWDSPHNLMVCENCPNIYRCPSYGHHDQPFDATHTNYVAVTGPDCVMNGANRSTTADTTDDPAETIVIVDVGAASVPWTAPQDISVDELIRQFGKDDAFNHSGGVMIAGTLNNEWHALPPDIPAESIRALATKAGGEEVGDW